MQNLHDPSAFRTRRTGEEYADEHSRMMPYYNIADSRLEGVNRAKLKFTNINTTTSRVSVSNIIESGREGAKQIASK
jgi:hypothetical protein